MAGLKEIRMSRNLHTYIFLSLQSDPKTRKWEARLLHLSEN